jgi:hypothetical protein
MSGLVVGVPPAVLELVQSGLLERAFHDGLVPALLYRSEAAWEEWPANTGTEIFMTRPGLLTPVTKALGVGMDPTPQTVSYEQWGATLGRYASTIDTHIPTSVVSNSDQFLRNIHQLGIQAGMSLNRIPRNALFQSYLSGQTVLIAATGAASKSIRVAALNGFTDVVTKGVNARPRPVSPSSPLSITIVGVTGPRNVVGYDPDNPDDPNGPGTLILDAVVGAVCPPRSPVLSVAAPLIIRSGGGSSVDAIGSGDTFVLQDAINATGRLRKNNVMPHEDGFYHAHISNDGNSQVFGDPALQRALTALPDSPYYQQAFIGTLGGIAFFLNNEAPESTNSGAMTATGTNAVYSEDMGAETVNETGVGIGRIVVTGRGALIERALDEKQYVTEAGITGKVGEFSIVNNGIGVETNGVRLILRAPLNRLQDVVAATWSISTSFPVPSDITSGGPQRFKRAIIIEHALN